MSEAKSFKQPWDIWQHNKFTLYGEPWKDSKEKPSVKFVIWENNPRFRLYLNNGKQSKPIPFTLDCYIAEEIFEMIREVVNNKEPDRKCLELKAKRDHLGNNYDKPTGVAKIFIGRDNEGVVYIAFQGKGEPLAKFPFSVSTWAEWTDVTGERIGKNLISEKRALSVINTWSNMMAPFVVFHGKEKIINKDGNSNRTGSWGKSKPSNPGNDSFSAEEDVEF